MDTMEAFSRNTKSRGEVNIVRKDGKVPAILYGGKLENQKISVNKKEVKNIELWKELDSLVENFNIKWSWVKAHSTDQLNNEVDLMAKKAASLN